MKLYYSTTSPYSRKVRLVLLEKGLNTQCEEIIVNPFNAGDASKENAELIEANPLGRIPTLVLDNGEVFFDSPLICQYLDSLSSDTLIPNNIEQRLKVLKWEALADGLTDAAFNIVMETRRTPEEQSSMWISSWSKEALRSLKHIENNLEQLGEELTLAHLSLASAVAYLEFRLPNLLQHPDKLEKPICPNLLIWYAAFKMKPSMQATAHHN